MIMINKGDNDYCGVEMIVVSTAAAAASIFLVLTSLLIHFRSTILMINKDDLDDYDVDLLLLPSLSMVLLVVDLIQCTGILINGGDHDDDHDVEDMLIVLAAAGVVLLIQSNGCY